MQVMATKTSSSAFASAPPSPMPVPSTIVVEKTATTALPKATASSRKQVTALEVEFLHFQRKRTAAAIELKEFEESVAKAKADGTLEEFLDNHDKARKSESEPAMPTEKA